MTERYTTHGEEETREVAARFARSIRPGQVIALEGDLGAGKTVFVRGVAEARGAFGQVTSPTFTLINEYAGDMTIYHMDLYRLDGTGEMEDIGVEDYFDDTGVCFVEWAEKLGPLCPPDAVRVSIEHAGPTVRHITIERTDAS